jgi:hypothetical protein
MHTKPFNPDRLWRSSNQPKSNTLIQPPMVLPKINTLTGIYKSPNPSISDELAQKNAIESAAYWREVNYRKALYRMLNQ